MKSAIEGQKQDMALLVLDDGCGYPLEGKRITPQEIMAYCTVYNMTGPNTVYSQQLKFLNKDPIKAFWGDLASKTHKWQLQ